MFQLVDENVEIGARRVLQQISLQVKAGEQLALIGPSGAGKTTLLRRLHQLQPEAALVHQDHALVPRSSSFNNVLIGRLDRSSRWRNLRNLVAPAEPERSEIAALLHRLGMDEDMFQAIAALSGGQRQRVAVARALYRGGKVLLADEPVSAVDPHRAGSILEILKQAFPTLLLSLHSVQLARTHFPRLVGMRDGGVFFDLPSERVSDGLLADLFRPC